MTAFYNEIDPFAAAWLRELIEAGHIAPGIVDERSIEDITPDELEQYDQCHFFAGIGVWGLALRCAGVPDTAKVWTGSCPCQPFSSAGQGAGFADERHLWPAFFHLVEQCRPELVFGEQVASSDAGSWVDLVQTDLEAVGYAFGAVPFPAAGVGAPHIRDRLYWVADANGSAGRQGSSDVRGWVGGGFAQPWAGLGRSGVSDGLVGVDQPRLRECVGIAGVPCWPSFTDPRKTVERTGIHIGGLADSVGRKLIRIDPLLQWEKSRRIAGDSLETAGCGPVNGLWGGSDWLYCRDDRWRPVEPGTFPLADAGTFRNRVGMLRGAGNAINLAQAQAFIEAYYLCLT